MGEGGGTTLSRTHSMAGWVYYRQECSFSPIQHLLLQQAAINFCPKALSSRQDTRDTFRHSFSSSHLITLLSLSFFRLRRNRGKNRSGHCLSPLFLIAISVDTQCCIYSRTGVPRKIRTFNYGKLLFGTNGLPLTSQIMS